MPIPIIPYPPSFAITPIQAAFGTVLTAIIPPNPGLLYALVNGRPNWWDPPTYIHLLNLQYTTSTTAHAVYVMRPTNWTTFKTAVAKNTTAITLTDDPGVYSTNFRYPYPGQPYIAPGTVNAANIGPTQVADDTLATSDYVAYQLADGTWQLDTIASGTFAGGNLVLTTGTPNRNGATIAAGAPLFMFGDKTEPVPQTGRVHENFLTIASSNKQDLLGGAGTSFGAGFPALNPGDPMVVLSSNVTATGVIDLLAGVYARF